MLKTVATVAFAGSLVFLVQSATGPPPFGGTRHFRLRNETREPIVELHFAAFGSGMWQGDVLGSDYLPPGGSVPVDIEDRNQSCRVDVEMVLDDGSERVSRGVDICRVQGYAVSLR
jgi:hypothetical protein